MNDIEILQKKFFELYDYANVMRTANQFEEMRSNLLEALKFADFFSEYFKKIDTAKSNDWKTIAEKIASTIKAQHLAKPILDSQIYKCSMNSIFTISCSAKCGTCFLVDIQGNNYFFLTNRHVVDGYKNFLIQSQNKELSVQAELVNASSKYDIAVVKARITSTNYHLVPVQFANIYNLVEGMKIYIIGNRSGLGLGFITGHVGSFRNEKLLLNVTTEHGTSGSAIVDEYGSVIGINCGDILEVPFGLHASVILDYLKTLGIKVKFQMNVKY